MERAVRKEYNLGMDFEASYKNLNTAQRQAVDAIDGPVQVVAGPGTGKTQVIALRIGNILKKTDTPPDGVLCLTFTNSGVHAMRQRLRSYIGASAGRVAVSTFHAFGTALVEEFFKELGFVRPPETLDDAQMLALADEILNTNEWQHIRPRGDVSKYFGDLKSVVSLLKRENMSPKNFLAEIEEDIYVIKNEEANISTRGESKGKLKKDALNKIESLERTKEVVRFYELYETAKSDRGVMDYDDILAYMVKLVSDSENARDTLRERYLYVLVDEHQDSSGIQNAFLKAVWGDVEKPNIFAVGDDRQLIYGFGGAHISYFEDFARIFRGTKLITLTENYRSTQIILDAADALLQSKMAQGKLNSQSDEKHPVVLLKAEYPRDEILRAGNFFMEKISGGIAPEECALLVPKNHQVRSALKILSSMGIPASGGQSLKLFETKEFRSIYLVLQIVSNPFASIAIAESLLDEVSGVPVLSAHEFLHRVYTRDLSVRELVSEGRKDGLLAEANPVYSWGKKLEQTVLGIKGKSLYDILQQVGNDFLLDKTLDHNSYVHSVEVVRSLLHVAISMEEKNPHTKLADMLEMLHRMQEYDQDIPLAAFGVERGVRVMTLHGSKGLEFECVWVAHMSERSLMLGKRMGFSLPKKLEEKVEEKNEDVAKRELYVAITRAKKFCVLSYASFSDSGRENTLARIVDELPEGTFEFSDGSWDSKEIFENKNYINRDAVPQVVTKEDLCQLVAKEYHKKKVSVTMLNTFFECPWKWYFRSFLQIPEPMSESLIFGSLVHGVIEDIVKDKKKRNTNRIDTSITEHIRKLHVLDENNIKRWSREAKAVALRFVDEFIPAIFEDSQSEKSLSYKDPAIPDILITGKIDLVETDKSLELRVTDFKTGKVKNANEIERLDEEGRLSSYFRQLAMYTYLLTNSTGGKTKVGKSRLYFVEEKDTKKALYETHVSAEHVGLLVQDIRDYDASIRNGDWTERKCNFKSWGSSATECPYCKMAEMYK